MKNRKMITGILLVLNNLFFISVAHADMGTFDYSRLSFRGKCKVALAETPSAESAETLMNTAAQLEAAKSYCKAVQLYGEVRRQAPLNELYPLAQYKLVKALYADESFDEAITEANEFLTMHPMRPEAEEILFLVAQSFYSDRGTSATDQDWTWKAQKAFSDYLKKYPKGKFGAEAREKLETCYNEQAYKEILVAQYYLEREQYTAVAMRVDYFMTNFKSSKYKAEMLGMAVTAYIALDKYDDAKAVAKILEKLAPSSEILSNAKAELRLAINQ